MSVPNFISQSLGVFKDLTDISIEVKKINPFNGQSFSAAGTREITFKLPRDKILLGTNSYFYFKAKPDADSAADDEFQNDIHTCFDRHTVKVGSQTVVEENEFGWWRSLEFLAKASESDLTSASTTVMNIPDNSISGVAKKYRIPLASKWNNKGFFSQPLPLYKMDQVEITYEINSSIAEYTTATTAVGTVDITVPELELYFIDSPTLRKLFDVDLVRNFRTFFHYHSVLTSGATQLSVNIPASFQNLRGLAMIQRNSATSSDPNWETGNDALENLKYCKSFLLNSLTKFDVSVDGKPYPSTPIDGSNAVELVSNLERFWGNADRLGAWFDSDTMTATNGKGYYAISFSADDDNVSGLNSASKTGTIVVRADLTVGVNTDVDFFVVYDRFYKISKNGDISVTK